MKNEHVLGLRKITADSLLGMKPAERIRCVLQLARQFGEVDNRLEKISFKLARSTDLARVDESRRIVREAIQILLQLVSELDEMQLASARTRSKAGLHLLLGKEERNAIIGDLVEEYNRTLRRFGPIRASLLFCQQVVFSMWPLLRQALIRLGTRFGSIVS